MTGETKEMAGCEITRLPEELLAASLSLTTPLDACRAAATSTAFLSAVDSDAVWSCFLPRELPPLAAGEFSPPPESKKDLFLRLADRHHPVLLADGLMSIWLERKTGAKCYILSARALQIVWGDTPQYWRWIPLAHSRFSDGAELLHVCWLEIHGKIQSKMLSCNSNYAAYFVFKLADGHYGLANPAQEASVTIGGIESTCQVCLQGYSNEEVDGDYEMWTTPYNRLLIPFGGRRFRRRTRRALAPGENVMLPQARGDGWMEVEMGEFFSGEGDDGEVCISLTETKGGHWKKGIIVQGIEIRAK